MIPYLFKNDSLSFNTMGFGVLNKVTECKVREELNGAYELNMTILTDDENFENLKIGSIIVAKPNINTENQAFVVESMTMPINNVVSVYATHIAQHRTKLIPISPVNSANLQTALTDIISNAQETCPFTLSSNKTSNAAYKMDRPMSLREVMGGTEGSLLDVYGGEYRYNNFNIELLSKRGNDNGVQVVYGKNMTEFEMNQDFSWNGTATGVLPFYYTEDDGLVQGDIQYSVNESLYPYHKTVTVDFTDKFETKPTKAQLESEAAAYISQNGSPAVNIKVAFNQFDDMVQGDTKAMTLGDTVHVLNSNYSISYESRIVAMDFDVLCERYETIEIGDLQTTINEAIAGTETSSNINVGGSAVLLKATGTGTTTSMSAGTITRVPLDTALITLGSGLSISDNGIKVEKAGVYRVTGSVYIEATSSATRCGVYIANAYPFASNAELAAFLMPKPNASWAGALGTNSVVELSANQTVYLYGRSVGAAGSLYQSNTSTFLIVERIK